MEKVFKVAHDEDGYFLQEVDATEFIGSDGEIDDLDLDLGYCSESMPYKQVLTYQSEYGSKDTSYYYDEEMLRDLWEDELIDELQKYGSFVDYEDDIRYELFVITRKVLI